MSGKAVSVTDCQLPRVPTVLNAFPGLFTHLVIFTTRVIDYANKNTLALFISLYYHRFSEGLLNGRQGRSVNGPLNMRIWVRLNFELNW